MRQSAIYSLFLVPLAVLAAPVAELEERQAAKSINSLLVAKGKKYFATCTDQGRLTTGKNAAIIQANFGGVTPENSMKWDSTERTCFGISPDADQDLIAHFSFPGKLQLCWCRLLGAFLDKELPNEHRC